MSSTSPGPDALDPRVNQALQEYLEKIDRGEAVDQEEFLAQHLEIADQLRSFIADAVDLARRVTPDAITAAEISTNRSLSETTPPTTPGAVPTLPEVFGRYRVMRLLGRGAMGAVYLAEDTQLARQVALKIPHFDSSQPEELLQRFYREARTAATLRNPHICPVYDVGEINGQHYISMAYIEGHPLSEIIKTKGQQPERQVLTLVRKLALALQEAHNQGVIHRDLKPGNIMVDARGEPVVMDFGLACQVREGAERLTHSGVILGSPAYMSPEQLEGDTTKVTPSADQYALGVILYELLTGQLPFRGTISAVVGQIITKPAPAPQALRPELDPRINQLCLQMLAKTPAKRLDSMKAVADRILAIMKEPATNDSSVSTPAPNPSAAETTPAEAKPVAETIVPNGANLQQQVAALIKQGELQAALDVLAPLAQRKAGKQAEWARQKLNEVHALLQTGQRDQAALCLLAGKLIRKADYAEAIRILSEIPVPARTDELNDLLSDAEAKEEEATLLLQDIETAVRKDQPKELPALVKRFLQLKPGNKAIRTLAEDLKRYGAEKVIRLRRNQRNFLDVAGATWNPMHAVYFVIGLALVCTSVYAVALAFQTPHGTVIVEVHDPHVVLKFANEEITATSSGKTYRLKTTDKKTLQVDVDGVTIDGSTQEITVEKNETKIITAKLVDGKLDLAINREKKTFTVTDATIAPQKPGSEVKEHVGVWIDLLAIADPAEMKGSNFQWTRDGSILRGKVLPPATYAWIPIVPKQEINGDYDLEIDYLVVGTDHLQIGLPLNETIATLGLNEKLGCGLDWIDGLTAEAKENNAPPHGNPEAHIKTGVVQHVTASVRHQGDNVTVVTKLDDVETGRFSGLRSRISTPSETAPKFRQIKLVSPFQSKNPDHRLEIHKARVRFINPSAGTASNDTEWTALFNGRDLTNWSTTPDVWQVRDGVLEIDPARLKENSYLWSADSYTDFELRFRYRLKNEGYLGLGMHFSLDEGRLNVGPLLQLGYYKPKGEPNQLDAGGLFALIDRKPTSLVGVLDQNRYQLLPAIRDGKENQKWSDVTVRCEGRRIRAEINGIQTVDFTDTANQLPLAGKLAFYSPAYQKAAAEIKDVRIRKLSVSSTTPVATTSSSPASKPSSAALKTPKVLLDVDFRKTADQFGLADEHHILSEHKDGEYRLLGKKTGWWYNGGHPVFWKKENNQIQNFAIEVDVRLASQKPGSFAIEFGQHGDNSLWLYLNQLGQLRVARADGLDIMPLITPREMRPVSQFNTLRLQMENKTIKLSVNGTSVFEKLLDRYSGGRINLWLGPDDPPLDVRLQRIRIERFDSDESLRRDQEVRRFKGHTGVIRGIAFLPDGTRAVSVGHEKAFKLWDVATGDLLHDFTGHPDHVTSVSVSGDGKRALTGCWDKQVRLWDLEERKLLKTLKGHTDKVVSVLLSRDGLSGLSLSNDGVIRQWDLKAGKSTVVPGPAPYGVLAINPAENVIASGNGDGTVVLRGPQGIAPLIGHTQGYVEGLAFTPDGSKLVTGADDGTVRVWDLKTGKELQRLVTDGAGVDTVAITNDGRYVLAGSSDRTIVTWDILTGDKIATLHSDSPVMHRFALSPDNRMILSGGGDIGWAPQDDYELRLWNVPSPPAPK